MAREAAEQRIRERLAGQPAPAPAKVSAKRAVDTNIPSRIRPAQAPKQRATQPVKWWIKSKAGEV